MSNCTTSLQDVVWTGHQEKRKEEALMRDKKIRLLKKLPLGTKIRFMTKSGKFVIAIKRRFVLNNSYAWIRNNEHYSNNSIPSNFEILPR